MARHCSTRDFFRQMPNALLARYFHARGLFGELDFAAMKETQPDELFAAWLAQHLIGKPGATAPAPLTVVVQQLSGRDPLVEKLAKPHIDRVEDPALHADDDINDALKAQVAAELRALEAQKSTLPATPDNAEKSTESVDSMPS